MWLVVGATRFLSVHVVCSPFYTFMTYHMAIPPPQWDETLARTKQQPTTPPFFVYLPCAGARPIFSATSWQASYTIELWSNCNWKRLLRQCQLNPASPAICWHAMFTLWRRSKTVRMRSVRVRALFVSHDTLLSRGIARNLIMRSSHVTEGID